MDINDNTINDVFNFPAIGDSDLELVLGVLDADQGVMQEETVSATPQPPESGNNDSGLSLPGTSASEGTARKKKKTQKKKAPKKTRI